MCGEDVLLCFVIVCVFGIPESDDKDEDGEFLVLGLLSCRGVPGEGGHPTVEWDFRECICVSETPVPRIWGAFVVCLLTSSWYTCPVLPQVRFW